MGLYVPEAYGGAGLGALAFCLAVEEIAWACASTAVIYLVQYAAGYPIVSHGTDAQKRRYLPRLATGEITAALSHLGARRRLRRRRDDHHRRAQGRPLRAQRHQDVGDERQPRRRHHALRHRRPRAAATRASRRSSSSRRSPASRSASSSARWASAARRRWRIHLTDCEVPVDNRLGEEGEGFRVALGGARPLAPGGRRPGRRHRAGGARRRRRLREGAPASSTSPSPSSRASSSCWPTWRCSVHAARLLVHHAAALVDRGVTGTRAGIVDGQVLRRATRP